MNARPYFPLLAKVLVWLSLHLLILALAFVGFVGWQLELGLDSLLSGSAGERLKAFGESARGKMIAARPNEWNPAIAPLAREKGVFAAICNPGEPKSFPLPIPNNVLERARTATPVQPGPPGRRPPPPHDAPPGEGRPPPGERGPPPGIGGDFFPFPEGDGPLPPHLNHQTKGPDFTSRPVFLLRGNDGDGYWAGVHLMMPGKSGRPPRRELLLVRADRLDGSGMFFDFKPWLWGGLAVLAMSLAFWTPFVLGTTRYIRRLTSATDNIAAGQFKVALPRRGNDELGNLGHAIETMAGRLDHLISGQKRFLGDAAHELCAPLARLRTGLGILEMKLGTADQAHLGSIEADAQELATLVEEILAFSRAGNRTPRAQNILLETLVREVVAKEGADQSVEVKITPGLTLTSDPRLLGRALANLIRNARIHAGPTARIVVSGQETPDSIELVVSDDGPGVAADELSRLFEPFYRPDRSRSRETGGSGLGLAIVRTGIEACGGETTATLPAAGGFAVTIRLPKIRPEMTRD
jgi:two-component system, OmpR family, sensor histidine kinase CpxA